MPIVFTYRSFGKNKNNDTPSGRRAKKASLLLAALLTLAITIIATSPSIAVHKGAGDLVCGGCHTMHSSQGGANGPSMGGATGSFLLLRSGSNSINSRGEIHKLCLQCHSQTGSQKDNVFQPHNQPAPKVLGSNWDQTKSFGEIGAGGDFVKEIDGTSFDPTSAGSQNALGYGHSVGLANATPPGNDNAIGNPFALTCTACHDPHGVTKNTWWGDPVNYGVNVYRNLIMMRSDLPCQTCHTTFLLPNAPGDMANMKSWVGGITGTALGGGGNYTPSYTTTGNVAIWPVYRKDGNPATAADNNVYDGFKDPDSLKKVGSALVTEGSMGEWCARCHPKMHEGTAAGSGNGPINTASGNDWKRHPANRPIDKTYTSGAGVTIIDWTHYNNDIAPGFKVPAANTDSTDPLLTQEHYYADKEESANPGKGDKVFCLSCHFAHAGPYLDALRWDYTAVAEAGSQTGNGVPSNRGCQQCHNR